MSTQIDTSDKTAMMQRVLDLAAKGGATTQPNPMVGCVIVKDGEIVGEGFHHMAGELHAERLALKQAGERARGATVYVNLEPCCHQGRTPPCTDGLIDAGVSEVVAAMRDPNPRVEGGGVELLENAGVDVELGLLEQEAKWLNRGFVSRMSRKRPWVILKSAATLDGRTAAFDGKSKWITGPDARSEVQKLRAHSSAVVTGSGTVAADDPQLNVRIENQQRQPYRVVLDSRLQIPHEARIIGSDQRLLIFTLSDDMDKISALIESGAEVIQQQGNCNGQLDLAEVLTELSEWQCNEILIEAGQTLSGAFLKQGLVDELELFYAGSLLGDQGKSMFHFDAPLEFENRAEFRIMNTQMVGADIRVSAVSQPSLEELNAV